MSTSEIKRDDSRTEFLRNHLSEILTQEAQLKFFRQYEFSKKQGLMKDFWKKALSLYFKVFLGQAMSRFEDILQFFTLEGNGPIGLHSILSHLVQEESFLLIKNEMEIVKMNKFLEREKKSLSQGIFQQVVGFFSSSKQSVSPTDIVIHVPYFKHLYEDCKGKLPDVFGEDIVLDQKEFNRRKEGIFFTKEHDSAAIIYLLKFNQVLHHFVEQKTVFYYLQQELDNELLAAKQIILLKKQVEDIDRSLQDYD